MPARYGRRQGASNVIAALEQVLQEIHIRRRESLRGWQESTLKRNKRERYPGRSFPDRFGKDMERLSLVHPSWTSTCRHALGRILVLPDLSLRSARAAKSAPTFGEWTREVHLSFSRNYDEGEEIWDAIASVLSRTPAVLSFCLQTSSTRRFRIHICVKKLAGILDYFTQLHTLRLYCDGTGHPFLPITEHQSLFHSLENLPHLERFFLQNFLPCYKLSLKYKNGQDEEEVMPPSDLDESPDTPEPYLTPYKVEDSSPLTGKVYKLAELIRRICNSPTELNCEYVVCVGNSMSNANFVLDPNTQHFAITSASISDINDSEEVDIPPPSFPYEKWCDNMKSLHIEAELGVFKNLRPFPSLKFLEASLSASTKSSPNEMREEVHGFLISLPPTLEILSITLRWEFRGHPSSIPLEMHDELDGMLAMIPGLRYPHLRVFAVEMGYISELFHSTMPLKQLIASCGKHKVSLLLPNAVDEDEYYGAHDRQEIEYLLDFDNRLDCRIY